LARQEIAVIGGGAKAAALATKAWCLRETGRDVHVTIFERAAIGAHWDGAHGYTDGDQALCTPAERDLGFPYDTANFGTEVARLMQARFSWMAHTVEAEGDVEYADWVNRGGPRPSHRDFATYIRDAVAKTKPDPILEDVTGLRFQDNKWGVLSGPPGGGARFWNDNFDGVVVTSPGPQIQRFRCDDPRFFDGESFWRELPLVRSRAEEKMDSPILILGAGGTAAAVAAWLVANGFRNHDIRLINDSATLYTRTSNYFENRLFNDIDVWKRLDPKERARFTRRLTRGVVWDSVAEVLATAGDLSIWPGRVCKVVLGEDPGDGTAPELVVHAKPAYPEHAEVEELPAAMVIDATGFNRWWFAGLLPDAERDKILADKVRLTAEMGDDLSLPISHLPGLHAPFVSDAVGPGFTSLMVLGAMADQILLPYVERARI
jgi:mycobactin lysine-N-oxygenase